MVKINNDGKGKHQSFTAKTEFDMDLQSMSCHDSFSIEGYGSTEEEALSNLEIALKSLHTEILKKIGEQDEPDIQYINDLGEPIIKDWQ